MSGSRRLDKKNNSKRIQTQRARRTGVVLACIFAFATVFALLTSAVTASATAEENTISADALTADGQTFTVTVSYDEAAGIPEGSVLSAAEIAPGTAAYQDYLDQAAQVLGQTGDEGVSYARLFDIEILNGGDKIEPQGPVSVRIELANAPQVEGSKLMVVHFEEDGPVVMESETVAAADDATADILFQTESFSAYAVLTVQLPQGVDDLDGWKATLDHDGRYITSDVEWNSPFKLRKTYNPNDAAVWEFEFVEEFYGYQLYRISTEVNGEKRYLHMWDAGYGAHTTLQTPETAGSQGCPQSFAVVDNNDGTYSIFNNLNGTWFWLNEWGDQGGAGYAGWFDNNYGSHLHINIQNNQPTVQNGGNYAVIIKDEATDTYYAVQEDGSLVEAEYDEDTGVARVKLERPFVWAYTSVHDGLDDNGQNYNESEAHPDWEPFNIRSIDDARGYNPGTHLGEGFYYEYLTPETDSGLAQENEENPGHGAKWAHGIRYEDHNVHGITWNFNTQDFDNTGHYLGADFDNLTVKGNVSQAEAATVFLALIENVPDVGSNNETVSHIDIGIVGRGEISVPLAYGTYYDEDGTPVLVVDPDEDFTLDLTQDFPVDKDDLMSATLTAYDKNGNELDDAFYISGYSSNEETGHSDVQVRMEGSFKVSTLDPYQGPIRSNDDQDRRAARLENPVYYEVATNKDVTFDLVYEGKQLYDMNGKPLSITAPMDIVARFSYWDDAEGGNECPPLLDDFETTYPFMFPGEDVNAISGRNYRNWQAGAIIDNDTTSYMWAGDYPPYIGDSGMDFRLTIKGDVDVEVLAVEVTKSIVDEDGELIHPADPVTNNFSLYYNAEADPASVADHYAVPPNTADDLADKQADYEEIQTFSMDVDSEGTARYYSYDVEQGMFYVEEDSEPLDGGDASVVIDENGKHWLYKETRVETEYVWRQQGDDDLRHVVEDGYSSVPEVLGEYMADDELHRNGFLEFFVYNVYEAKQYPLYIKKVSDDKEAQPLAGAEFDVYGPYEEEPPDPKQEDMKLGTITTDEDGMALVGELTEPGMYYLFETKAPEGYVLSEDPIIVTLAVENDGAEGEDGSSASVFTAEGANVSGDVEELEGEDGAICYQLTIKNPKIPPEPEPDLPVAGDRDAMPLVALSLALVALGMTAVLAVLAVQARRREQR